MILIDSKTKRHAKLQNIAAVICIFKTIIPAGLAGITRINI